jgi:hypothetical protein
MPIIYKITSPSGANYVGSTRNRLSTRKACHLSSHRCGKSNQSSFIVLDEAGPDACEWFILEICDHDVRYQREKFWIESMPCVNKVIPGRSAAERKAINRAYRDARLEEVRAYYAAKKKTVTDDEIIDDEITDDEIIIVPNSRKFVKKPKSKD